jgi:hypothetical protein
MPASSREPRVPKALRGRVEKIFEVTDAFCAAHLDEEYAALCRRLVAKLARKRPSPLLRGDLQVWAASALYAVGANNFLFDPTETPHLSADQLSQLLSVPKGTMAGKAKRIRDALEIGGPMDVEFCRRELFEDHPLAWLVGVNGMIVDARSLPAELARMNWPKALAGGLPTAGARVSPDTGVSDALIAEPGFSASASPPSCSTERCCSPAKSTARPRSRRGSRDTRLGATAGGERTR